MPDHRGLWSGSLPSTALLVCARGQVRRAITEGRAWCSRSASAMVRSGAATAYRYAVGSTAAGCQASASHTFFATPPRYAFVGCRTGLSFPPRSKTVKSARSVDAKRRCKRTRPRAGTQRRVARGRRAAPRASLRVELAVRRRCRALLSGRAERSQALPGSLGSPGAVIANRDRDASVWERHECPRCSAPGQAG
jgi:hypothetical protein